MKKTIILLGVFAFTLSACNNSSSKEDNEKYNCAELKESAEYVMNIPKKVKPEYVSAYKSVFEKCQAETLKEEPCIEYKLLQSIADSTEFHIYERWTNKQGQKEHTQKEHLKEFLKACEGFFDKAPGKLIESYICEDEVKK